MKIPGGKPKKTALWLVPHDQNDPLDEAYYPKIMALAAQLPKGVRVISVAHDDNCPKLKGGPCRCDAAVVDRGPVTP